MICTHKKQIFQFIKGSGIDNFLKSIDFKEWQSSGEGPEEHKSLYLSLRYGWNDDEDIASAEDKDLTNKATLVHTSKERLSKKVNTKPASKAKSQDENKGSLL